MNRFCWMLIPFGVGLSAIAVAADPADPLAAEHLVLTGATLYRNRQFEQARETFERAYALSPRSSTLLNLALAEFQTQRYVEALWHLRHYVRAPDADTKRAESVRTKVIPRAEAKTAHVQLDVPDDAKVDIDGEPASRIDNKQVDLTPGYHLIEVRRGGHANAVHVDLAAGEHRSVRIEFATDVRANAQDSPPVRTSTLAPADAAERSPPPARTWTVVGLGVASLATFGVATGFYVASLNDNERSQTLRATLPPQEDACTAPVPSDRTGPCGQLQDAVDAKNEHRNRAVGFAVAGGALAVAAVGAWWLWPKPKGATAWVAPHVSREGGGVRVEGAF